MAQRLPESTLKKLTRWPQNGIPLAIDTLCTAAPCLCYRDRTDCRSLSLARYNDDAGSRCRPTLWSS